MYSKNPQDGVGTSPGATNSWKRKKEEDIFRLNCEYYYPAHVRPFSKHSQVLSVFILFIYVLLLLLFSVYQITVFI